MTLWLRRLCFTALVAGFPLGCAWARRASVDTVDPGLRARGSQLDRVDEPKGFRLGSDRAGSYLVSLPELKREPAAAAGLLTEVDPPRPIEQHRLDLGLQSVATGRQWAIHCVSQRRRSASMDYAAVLDENRDEIAVECSLSPAADPKSSGAAAASWTFRTEAELSHNFGGHLSQQGSDRTLNVEVVVWVERFGKLRRHLPEAVAQVRDGSTAIAAMMLERPEQAWVATSLDAEVAEVALCTMLALRFLPLDLEG